MRWSRTPCLLVFCMHNDFRLSTLLSSRAADQHPAENRGGARTVAHLPIGATSFFIAVSTHNPDILRTLLAAGAARLVAGAAENDHV